MKIRQKLNLPEPQRNRTGTGKFFNLIMTNTVFAVKKSIHLSNCLKMEVIHWRIKKIKQVNQRVNLRRRPTPLLTRTSSIHIFCWKTRPNRITNYPTELLRQIWFSQVTALVYQINIAISWFLTFDMCKISCDIIWYTLIGPITTYTRPDNWQSRH